MTPTRRMFILPVLALVGPTCTVSTGASSGEIIMTEEITETEFAGLSYEAALTRFGKPERQEEFDLTSGVYEFRIELLNFYDAARLDRDPPRIREATWEYSGEEYLTLWFTQDDGSWRVLHNSIWDKGSEF